MAFAAGTRLGRLEISRPLGGELYRARDGRFGPEVTIRVLPVDDERIFVEASRVSHENVLAVSRLAREEGKTFLVAEPLEGATLGGPLPFDRAMDVARQLAEGLAALHAKGVVHRALGPGTVFLTKEGRVKILDVGLWMAADAPAPRVDTRADVQSFGRVLQTLFRDPPPAIAVLIRHCLDEDRERRFQSALDVGYALEALTAAAQKPRRWWRRLRRDA